MSRGRSEMMERLPVREMGAVGHEHDRDVKIVSWRDRIAAILLLAAGLGALASVASAVSTVTTAGPDTQLVEAWRMLGLLVFAGLFGLLAVWPRLIPGLWELVIMHKAGMAIFAATLIGRGVAGAETVALVDGTLAAMTIVAYVLTRGYSNWTRLVKG